MSDSLISEVAAEAPAEEAPVEAPAEELEVPQAQEEIAVEPGEDEGYLYAGKYKSIEELEKGHKELTKKLTEKNPGAPEEYDFDFSDNEVLKDVAVELDGDEIYDAMLPAFKEHGVTQEQAQGLLNAYLTASQGQLADIGNELAKLGPQGADMVSEVQRQVDRTFNENEKEIAILLGQSAEGIQFLHDRVVKPTQTANPPAELDVGPTRSADEAIAEAYAYKGSVSNFDNDAGAKRRYEKMMDDAMKLQIKEEQRG